ncbi:MAG: malonyl-CoA decarboxylase [Spongiibacteraceae bacterium]
MSRKALANLLKNFSQSGRELLRRLTPPTALWHSAATGEKLNNLAKLLLSGRGEASGVAIATDLLALYAASDDAQKLSFFTHLATEFNPDPAALNASWERYLSQGITALPTLAKAVESPRQELFRRLNLAPGGTTALVHMREDLLRHIDNANSVLSIVDADLTHLLKSWFNRGFLQMRAINWSSPASLLERVIRYEAVHHISNWGELRNRLDPEDRRCFGFFHPAMPDEPLIFVEVGLTRGIPDSIQSMLADDRKIVPAESANTAVFYSISNCQTGLRGISFGHFLIKQVAKDLSRELPGLKCFVTLSPIPGLMKYLDKVAKDDADKAIIARLKTPVTSNRFNDKEAKDFLLKHAYAYFIEARTPQGKSLDPVARFHLGNGARLERLNWLADTSPNGILQSGGLMVNYLYDLPRIEECHEAYVTRGDITLGEPFKKMAKAITAEKSENLLGAP